MGNVSEFKRAVRLVIENVSFEQDSTIQVFEASIRLVLVIISWTNLVINQSGYISRLLGGLLSAHLLITDQQKLLGDVNIENYDNELLDMAHDLAARLLPAFENTQTGIPHPRVSIERNFQEYLIVFLQSFSTGSFDKWSPYLRGDWNMYCRRWNTASRIWDIKSTHQRSHLWKLRTENLEVFMGPEK